MAERVLTAEAGLASPARFEPRPQELVMTLLGGYLQPRDRRVSSSGLVGLLGDFGFSAGAARVALARLVRRELIARVRRGRLVDYTLTPRSRAVLDEGDRRIFALGRTRRADRTDRQWTVLWHSIPENRRLERQRLVRRLRFLGFGQVQDGAWIAPHDREHAVAALLDELDVCQHAGVMLARPAALVDVRAFVGRVWDLDGLDARYRAFVHEFGGCDPAGLDDREAFLVRTRLVHTFRQFAFLDPELPDGLVPPPEHRPPAVRLFHHLYPALAPPAQRYFDGATSTALLRRGDPAMTHTEASPQHASLTYTSYLALDEILGSQRPRSDEHDEMLFIIIHQVYELWFKQLLHEMRHLQGRLDDGDTPHVLHTLKRILTILKVVVAQIDVLETMTPRSFLGFRGRLEAASGFQSAQFRELEAVLGRRDPAAFEHYPEGSEARTRIAAAMCQPSLYDSFLHYLAAQGYQLPAEALHRDVCRPVESSAAVQRVLLQVYRDDGEPAQICERLVDVDEGIQEWRYRHIKMVERTIGQKPGTGGSQGAEYLRGTLFTPVFPDLWAVRSDL